MVSLLYLNAKIWFDDFVNVFCYGRNKMAKGLLILILNKGTVNSNILCATVIITLLYKKKMIL